MITVHDLGRQGAIWRTYGDGKKSFTFAELWKALIHIGRVDPEADEVRALRKAAGK